MHSVTVTTRNQLNGGILTKETKEFYSIYNADRFKVEQEYKIINDRIKYKTIITIRKNAA